MLVNVNELRALANKMLRDSRSHNDPARLRDLARYEELNAQYKKETAIRHEFSSLRVSGHVLDKLIEERLAEDERQNTSQAD